MTRTARHPPLLLPALFLAGALLLGSCAITLAAAARRLP